MTDIIREAWFRTKGSAQEAEKMRDKAKNTARAEGSAEELWKATINLNTNVAQVVGYARRASKLADMTKAFVNKAKEKKLLTVEVEAKAMGYADEVDEQVRMANEAAKEATRFLN
jgi:hypothetical protein